ncbi:hypothetical protein [Mesorhizobium muleiense]|uniref:Uncharacterized protein n=1 Tax=Mesorhizobium muleiense TaxID=1004279 RepID=A0A1G9JUV5_9HYPH|nr:hypothetical protein [Mesorhizobium muleiense]MCF6100700.1 hypothetical protein [Mesorhizobium muleiense]SDL41172.1 hypothetical protein SAMN05428953_13616 [Mesorhizobium muleiense]
MTRKTHTLLFGLALVGGTVLFALLVVREILVRIGYEANTVDPVMGAMFAVIGVPTFGCVVASMLPKFFADMFLNDTYPRPRFFGPRKQVDVDRAREKLRSVGLLIEDGPDEKNVVTNRGKHDASPHGESIKPKKVD